MQNSGASTCRALSLFKTGRAVVALKAEKPAKEIFMTEAVKGRLRYDDGSVYEGDLANGKPHGKGKLTYVYGGVYEGDWVNGEQTGIGKMTYPNGAVDQGRFQNSEFVGGK
jgi:hypothetical protein